MKARRGVLLIEILVSALLTGIVLVGIGSTFRALRNSTGNAIQSTRSIERRRVQHARVLALGRTALEGTPELPISGTVNRFQFRAQCMKQIGWTEPCRVEISVENSSAPNSGAFAIRVDGDVLMQSGQGVGTIGYLADTRNGGTWWSIWPDSIHVPQAVLLRSETDSLFLPVGSGIR